MRLSVPASNGVWVRITVSIVIRIAVSVMVRITASTVFTTGIHTFEGLDHRVWTIGPKIAI